MFLSSINKQHILPSALAVALLLSGCGEAEQTTQATSLPVDVYTVSTMEVPIVSNLTGRVSATRRAEVRPQVSGIVQKRLFTEGSNVVAGDQLYQIDPSLYEAEVNSAKANLKSAEASCVPIVTVSCYRKRLLVSRIMTMPRLLTSKLMLL